MSFNTCNKLVLTASALLALAAIPINSFATYPDGYYDTLDGKQGAELKTAIRTLADGHNVVTYNTKTWNAFEKTDVRTIRGKEVWWDMYSNNIVYLPEHAALNIEHSVANSWWGGKNGSKEAYSDLFHLNPSDQNANNKKGNNPPGEVVEARLLDNGLLRIGTPANGQGGGAATVFEPADEYKGDFARAYFYVFTAYDNLSWKSDYDYVYDTDGNLKPWAVEMLLRWNRQDPVDSKEIARNEAVYGEQNNRNPFIDYPQLAEYIWGDKASSTFSLSAEAPALPTDRPEAPEFDGMRLTGVNTYAGRWWDGIELPISHFEGELFVSIDGAPYVQPQDLYLDPAANGNETHTYAAYTKIESDGLTLRSPIARLTMTARDPFSTDYSAARWERVTKADNLDLTAGPFILLAAPTLQIMSTSGGTASTAFMECAGFVEFEEERVIELPTDAAIVRFESVGNGKSRLIVRDIYDRFLGSWNATAKNKMRLDQTAYTPGIGVIADDDTFSFTFDAYGSLQYNASQPRFLNYESNQKPVYLYRFKDLNGGWSGIDSVAQESEWGVGIDGRDIIVNHDTQIFDLSGRKVNGKALPRGVYIVVSPRGTHKVAL